MVKRIKLLSLAILASVCMFAQEEWERFCERSVSIVNTFKDYPELLANAARSLEDPTVKYDPSYVRIAYPMGDVPANTGVCTDVIIRAFRKGLNDDLQENIYNFRKEVHPEQKIDPNIDHRRVKNLVEYFDSLFDILELETHDKEYKKGNVVVWDLGGGQWHIGICVENDTIIHNICCGQVIEPMYMHDRVIRNYSFDVSRHQEIANLRKQQK